MQGLEKGITFFWTKRVFFQEKKEAAYVAATIIGHSLYKEFFVIGWKPNENRPLNANKRSGSLPKDNIYIPNESDYTYSRIIYSDNQVHSRLGQSTIDGFDGSQCRKCQNFFLMAVPNQDDGTFVCYSCRNRW